MTLRLLRSSLARRAAPSRRPLSELVCDDGAAIGPMVAVLAASLLVATGLALDVAANRFRSRDLRAATEAAALAAAVDPSQAEARAHAYLSRNVAPTNKDFVLTVTVGRYCADRDIPSNQRFRASSAPCPNRTDTASTLNAVRVDATAPSRRFLPGLPDDLLTATATATRIDEAGLEVTSGLITVTNSLVNAVNDLLGALLGIKLRLSTAEIEALMGGNVDAGLFFDKLAQRENHTGTYGELVHGSYKLQDIALAAADAAGQPHTATALRSFAGAVGSDYEVPLSGLFGLGVWKNMPVGEADAQPALKAGINSYQLISFAAQAGIGKIDLSDAVSLVASGSTAKIIAVANDSLKRPRFSFGPAQDTQAGTSALRLQLQLGIGDINVLGLGILKVNEVPLLIDVAAAHAQITAIECPGTSELARDTRVSVTGETGLVNAYIGTAPANAMTKPMPTVASDIGQATLLDLNVGLLQVTAKARAIAQPVLGQSAALTFSATGTGGTGTIGTGTIGTASAPGRSAVVGNGSQTAYTINTLVSSLSSGLDVDVRLLGLCVWPLCTDNSSLLEAPLLSALLSAVTTPITGLLGTVADPLLDNVLAALGIQLGHARVWVNGARCGVPVLV